MLQDFIVSFNFGFRSLTNCKLMINTQIILNKTDIKYLNQYKFSRLIICSLLIISLLTFYPNKYQQDLNGEI